MVFILFSLFLFFSRAGENFFFSFLFLSSVFPWSFSDENEEDKRRAFSHRKSRHADVSTREPQRRQPASAAPECSAGDLYIFIYPSIGAPPPPFFSTTPPRIFQYTWAEEDVRRSGTLGRRRAKR